MDIELIDKAWACLPREFKEKVKKKYARCVKIDADDNPNLPAYAVKSAISRMALLEKLFGIHNLTSDADGEEILTCEKSKAMQLYSHLLDLVENERISEHYSEWCDLEREYIALFGENVFADYFGSKCLPDKLNEDNFAKSEPKPSEPKNEGTRQEQYVPKNAESGTHSLNHILKDGFREHNRLHIAAMAMQGLISKAPRFSSYEISNLVRISLDCADALIKKAEGGSDE